MTREIESPPFSGGLDHSQIREFGHRPGVPTRAQAASLSPGPCRLHHASFLFGNRVRTCTSNEGGRVDRVHAQPFADLMTGLDLSNTYGYYLNEGSAEIVAPVNPMSSFGPHQCLHRAWSTTFPPRKLPHHRLLGVGPKQ